MACLSIKNTKEYLSAKSSQRHLKHTDKNLRAWKIITQAIKTSRASVSFSVFMSHLPFYQKILNLFYNFPWAIEFTKLPNAKYKYSINITSLNSI